MKTTFKSEFFLIAWFFIIIITLGSAFWILNNKERSDQKALCERAVLIALEARNFPYYSDLFFHSGNILYLENIKESASDALLIMEEVRNQPNLASPILVAISNDLSLQLQVLQSRIQNQENNSLKFIEPIYSLQVNKTWTSNEIADLELLKKTLIDLRVSFNKFNDQIATLQRKQQQLMEYSGAGSIAITLFLLTLTYVHTKKRLFQPLRNLAGFAENIANGQLHSEAKYLGSDLAPIHSAFRKIADHIHNATEFAVRIGEGKLETELTTNGGDYLGNALVDMRDKLKNLADDEKTRNWAISGNAKFSDIFRQYQHSELYELTYEFVSNLVKYTHANQGGVFLINEEIPEDKHIMLYGCYAYERKKQLQKRIEMGEGLVGQCIQERDTVYIEKVPASYMHITSGLGKKTPTCILLIPIKSNEDVFGAVELAFFNLLLPYQIKFVEAVCETFGATLSSTKMTMRTQKLLKEAQTLNEEMQQKEEEMRQNAEELEATQETLNRKLKELEEETNLSNNIIEAINKTNANIEFDLDGKILAVNDMYLSVMGYTRNELIGKNEKNLAPQDEIDSQRYRMLWDSLKSGSFMSGEYRRLSKGGREIWLNGTYNPIFDLDGNPYKVIQLAQFITEEKEKDLELSNKINAISSTFPMVELDVDSNIKNANQEFINLLGYKRTEFRNIHLHTYLGERYVEQWQNLLNDCIKKGSSSFVATYLTKEGSSKHCITNFNALKNLSGEIYKILVVLIDISEQKGLEFELIKNHEKLNQSIGELKTAKEEITKRKNELEAHINVLNKSSNILELNSVGKIVFANNQVCDLFQSKRSLLAGSLLFQNFHQDFDMKSWDSSWQLLEQGQLIKSLIKYKKAENGYFWGDTIISPVLDEDGHTIKMIVVIYDVTSQIEITQELKVSLAKEKVKNAIFKLQDGEDHHSMDEAFDNLIEQLGNDIDVNQLMDSEIMPILQIDESGKIITANGLVENLFVVDRKDIISSTLPELLAKVQAKLSNTLIDKINKGNVVKHKLKMGSENHQQEVLMISMPMFNSDAMRILILLNVRKK